MATKKATTKATTKATEVKDLKDVKEVKVEAPKAEVKKEEAKKAPAKKAATTKKVTTTKKEVVEKKADTKTEITVQFQGLEVAIASVEEKVKAQFVAEGHRASSIKSLNIYVKPEENSAYYVINEKETGRVDLF